MKLSIITVCKNALNNLIRTAKSIDNAHAKEIEWIVIDGVSTDGTIHFLETCGIRNLTFLSEKDTGMYDAMNKGILLSKGTFLLFLNAGDFLTSNGLAKALDIYDKWRDINVFNVLNLDENLTLISGRKVKTDNSYLKQYQSVPHQSTIIKKELFTESIGFYDTSFRYSGDYDFFCRCYRKQSVKFSYFIDIVLSSFVKDGMGSNPNNVFEIQKEYNRVQKKYFGRIHYGYFIFNYSLAYSSKFTFTTKIFTIIRNILLKLGVG